MLCFTMFREQNLGGTLNRQFKGPLAVRPVFLHTPHRVEALVFLLMIALMLYFLHQRSYRQNTPEDEPLTEHRMTAATLLKRFRLCNDHPESKVVESSVRRGYSSPNAILSTDLNFHPCTNTQPEVSETT